MKIIFLDIDGVLNTGRHARDMYYEDISKLRDDYGTTFCPQAVENLRKLVEAGGDRTYIVISSTWRLSGLKIMQEMWEKRGLPGKVIDVTVHSRASNNVSLPRGAEIDHYLVGEGYWSYRELLGEEQRSSTSIEAYVIIDDDSDMLYNQKDHFVHVDPHLGFADKRKLKRAINIIKKETK